MGQGYPGKRCGPQASCLRMNIQIHITIILFVGRNLLKILSTCRDGRKIPARDYSGTGKLAQRQHQKCTW